MKRTIALAAALPLILVGIGCQPEFYAKQIIEQNTGSGKIRLTLTGQGEQLVRENRIDVHRRFTMPDKTVIDVWVIKAETSPSNGTALLLHSLLESKAETFKTGQRLAKMGYDVILPDLRAHGRSTGKYVTYGALEKHDIKTIVDQLVEEGLVSTPIYAFGVNLGGSVAIQYAAIDPRCRGVMAVAPYKSAESFARRYIALVAPTMSNEDFETVLAKASQLGKFDFADASTIDAVRQLNCPILIVHGVFDLSVPLEQSKEVYEAASQPKKLIVVGLERMGVEITRDSWIAEKLDMIAKTGLKEEETVEGETVPAEWLK